ncbi:MAG: allantoicase [Pseudomonadota bacterium]
MDRHGNILVTEPHPFGPVINLAHPRLDARVVYATDDFFGDKSRLIDPNVPVFLPEKYDDNGKWMDGWESRRRRTPGHDAAIIRLGMPAKIAGCEIDTRHFTGNYPPEASIDACVSDEDVPADGHPWTNIVPRRKIDPNRQHFSFVDSQDSWTHVRLNIFPDGGVARLRIWGEVDCDFTSLTHGAEIDLFSVEYGGRPLYCNDEHFGTMHNLNAPGRGINMGDGWETARRRKPGNDWVIVALGHAANLSRIVVDTAHFKGNYPESVVITAATCTSDADALPDPSKNWPELLPRQPLGPDREHVFTTLQPIGPVTHVRMNIFPDGGISRLRLFGTLA